MQSRKNFLQWDRFIRVLRDPRGKTVLQRISRRVCVVSIELLTPVACVSVHVCKVRNRVCILCSTYACEWTHVSHGICRAFVLSQSENETRLRIRERCFFGRFTFASLVDNDDVTIAKKMKEFYVSLNKEFSLKTAMAWVDTYFICPKTKRKCAYF